eukprot:6729147-Lingulodinium_polyedra.AAC.1
MTVSSALHDRITVLEIRRSQLTSSDTPSKQRFQANSMTEFPPGRSGEMHVKGQNPAQSADFKRTP